MPSLRELDLSDNRLIADALEGPIFDLPNLSSLNLSFNKLSRLGDNVLSSLKNLKSLDVSQNGITNLQEDSFHQVFLNKIQFFTFKITFL